VEQEQQIKVMLAEIQQVLQVAQQVAAVVVLAQLAVMALQMSTLLPLEMAEMELP
jgi:hypothetical protein